MFQMYRFCTTFNCSPEEFLRRPYKECQWLMQLDATYQEAISDLQERASNK